jgi:hypothetical protein
MNDQVKDLTPHIEAVMNVLQDRGLSVEEGSVTLGFALVGMLYEKQMAQDFVLTLAEQLRCKFAEEEAASGVKH